MARVLSMQRKSIRREMTAQYTITEKHASKKLARVLSRQRRSIRRKTTTQYKMTAKPPYIKNWREFRLGKEGLSEGK